MVIIFNRFIRLKALVYYKEKNVYMLFISEGLRDIFVYCTHQTFEIKLVRDVQPIHHPQDTQTEVGVKCVTGISKKKMSKLGSHFKSEHFVNTSNEEFYVFATLQQIPFSLIKL